MGLTRRVFLQRAGLALIGLEIGDIGLSLWADRYQQALAQPTRRKLALLVGINQYPDQVCDYVPARGHALNGCLTDVALQQELLIHRFGFQPGDILTLTDQQATRDAIASAFLTHLGEQARPGDVVVVHFSGLGSRVKVVDRANGVQNSFVPIDGLLPTAADPTIHDLMEDTLGLLLRSLQTQQITTVLDLSHINADPVLQGNWRIRSRPSTPSGQLSETERQLQEQLISKLKLSPEQYRSLASVGQWPGVVLAATGANQVAIEGQWHGYSAGLFTYALTQQLWHSMPPTTLRFSLTQAAAAVKRWAGQGQSPQLLGQAPQTGRELASAYVLNPEDLMEADGVVVAVEEGGNVGQVWLGGLPPAVVDHVGVTSQLSLVPSITPAADVPPSTEQRLQVRSRNGLLSRVRWLDPSISMPIPVGQPVREATRLIPRNINLVVALDSTLERIERVDATSAFAAIPRVSAVVAGEQPADYLFGKTTMAQTLAASLSSTSLAEINPANDPVSKGSYGLFNLGRAVIPHTLADGDEAVKTAVNRLNPKLRTLLAAKLLNLTVNTTSSRLGVRATLEQVAPQSQILVQQDTLRAFGRVPNRNPSALTAGSSISPVVASGSQLRYRLQNYGDRPIYFALLGFDGSGNAIALYTKSLPLDSTDRDEAVLTVDGAIAPDQALTLPPAPAPTWGAKGPTGLVETYLIFSCNPLMQLSALLEAQLSVGGNYHLGTLSHPLDIAHALLEDLHSSARAIPANTDTATDAYVLDVDTWATLRFAYQLGEADTKA